MTEFKKSPVCEFVKLFLILYNLEQQAIYIQNVFIRKNYLQIFENKCNKIKFFLSYQNKNFRYIYNMKKRSIIINQKIFYSVFLICLFGIISTRKLIFY